MMNGARQRNKNWMNMLEDITGSLQHKQARLYTLMKPARGIKVMTLKYDNITAQNIHDFQA